jgi:hypothetical protein
MDRVALARGVSAPVALLVAYATSASFGPLAGSAFAVVTRHLRRWSALLLWSVVFFVSLAILFVAFAPAHARGAGGPLSGAVLLGSALFAVLLSFSLPIRRRR